ncbi:MAG: hypothetical protein K9G67_02370 [Bacteroidales bacterium]|nr:hypothetical protein [Bacteroidales bacterium]MCF8343643.1 hypothetical protein [Bacteroidales bacterium]MCF8352261.1 hypothetical protein [Bacteroidales bacterium]MCF8375177.1 hypothetical protein [Bacteroidales bacterium]MCF8400701.1 hypothetical protein [Bacteroidales bacterium]
MKNRKTIGILVVFIVMLSAMTASFGIFTNEGPGVYEYDSIRGKTVEIYGKGIYKHMSADVAVQGIGQDYVTLFIAIPVLLISLIAFYRGSLKARYVLAGTLGYFFVSFLFYTCMGMYNIMFLAYLVLLALSFFSLLTTLLSFPLQRLHEKFKAGAPVKFAGGFLIFNSVAIAIMWLGVIVPPLMDGSIYPDQLQHYTTLIVQGLDLGLLLPLCFVSAVLFLKRKALGLLAAPTYIVFLSLLMTALTAKLIAMATTGVSVVPAIFIIPAINLTAIVTTVLLLRKVNS